ncbi:MAG: polysaccharide deacetylase family protein [Betaproteobacteria bacterium]|jgi:peptidoglycan/xylan/chitin deacetylase (PgdA/CDA1 family)|nr:polysaccharide deacetylase family protein [Betaproteobacteria bacterium]MBK9677275.1 polysaccharide deacetylase family protein [Betaproteobacteria bacterium]
MLLALKIDVDTLRGTREGVPRLVELLKKHGAGATFFWSLGPDHTGRAIRRVFRPGFVRKVQRTSVVRHYGVQTLLYGTLLPGPDIGRRTADLMRSVRDDGFEVGIQGWDHVRWQDGVAHADAAWTRTEMTRACERFTEIFGTAPLTHGAAGWQMNVHALRLTQALGFEYAADGRGTHPHLPVWKAELIRCPQLPTTLPTLDELIGRDGVTEDNVAAHLLERTALPCAAGHVYTLRADLEGRDLAPAFDRLLTGWKSQGWRPVALRAMLERLQPLALPRCVVAPGAIPGRCGSVLVQGPEFLGDVDLAAA